MPQGRYNILLITSDHHRGDSLSILDHPVAFTPHLDKLAQQGIIFRRAYSECPVCIPARMSMMTGLRPGTGEGSMGYNYYRECSPLLPAQTLPELLSEAGYQTQAIGKMHFFPQRKRYGFHNMILDEEGRRLPGLFRDDYETWLLDNGFAGENHSHGVGNGATSSRIWHLPEKAHPTNWTARETCRWLNRKDPEVPFFLWLSFSAPHPPFTPPLAYWDLFKEAAVPEPLSGNWSAPERLPAEFIREQVPKNSDKLAGEWYRKTVRSYHALLTHIDFQISLVIGTLREKRLLDSTIFLYTSDH
ncbi:MAG TPA: sulfatase-like hydrolase/transferase, partial [Spirochaetia bacterium]|nr:sulfatase-like hydrolase/transferase [Spirochaetia bacterium]